MVAIKAAGVEAFVARPDPAVVCILVYGPDQGLVVEHAATLARAGLDDPNDPFAMVELDGDAVASDPGRLVDEALTSPLFGGRRSVRVRLGSRSIAPAVEALLAGPPPVARVVIEGGDLKKGAPVRALCEKNPRAAALPCYGDNAAALAKLIDVELAAAGLTMAPDARRLLTAALGADRMASRSEVEKLCLYAAGRGEITAEDVAAVVVDTGEDAFDVVVDAAFGGDPAAVDRALTGLAAAGTPVGVALGAALRHAVQLHRLRLELDAGERAATVVDRGWPGLHFSRKQAVQAALGRWRAERLAAMLERLSDAVKDSRASGALGDTIAQRTLAAIAAEARGR